MSEQTNRIRETIEKVLTSGATVEELARCIESISDPSLETICTNLQHYIADEDIRIRDQEYSDYQNSELKNLTNFLKEGNLVSASKITFLS